MPVDTVETSKHVCGKCGYETDEVIYSDRPSNRTRYCPKCGTVMQLKHGMRVI